MTTDLLKIRDELKELNDLQITYLLVNEDISFIDRSTLTFVQKKLLNSIQNIESLLESKA